MKEENKNKNSINNQSDKEENVKLREEKRELTRNEGNQAYLTTRQREEEEKNKRSERERGRRKKKTEERTDMESKTDD